MSGKKIGHVAKDDTYIGLVDLKEPAGTISIAVHDYTNQCVATIHVAGAISGLQLYSANSYEINVREESAPNGLHRLTEPQMPGHNPLQVTMLERIVDQLTHAMRLAAREVTVNSPEHPDLRKLTELAVRKIVELVQSYNPSQIFSDGDLREAKGEHFGPADLWRRLGALDKRVDVLDSHTHAITHSGHQTGGPIARSAGG